MPKVENVRLERKSVSEVSEVGCICIHVAVNLFVNGVVIKNVVFVDILSGVKSHVVLVGVTDFVNGRTEVLFSTAIEAAIISEKMVDLAPINHYVLVYALVLDEADHKDVISVNEKHVDELFEVHYLSESVADVID